MPNRRPNARWLALLVITGVVVYLCWLMLQPLLDVLLWGAVLAIVSYPLYRRLRERGKSAHVSSLLTTGIVVLTVLIPVAILTAMLVRQAAGAAEGVQRGVAKLMDPDSPTFKWLDRHVDLEAIRDPQALGDRLGKVFGAIAGRTLGLVGGVLGGILQVFFVLFTLYYLLRDAEAIVPAVKESLPVTPGQAEMIFRRTGEVIDASVKGVLSIAGIQAFLGMMAFWVLGLPSPLLWGVVMFVLATIPMAGTAIVWAPAAVYLLVTGSWVKAIMLTVWGAGVIGVIDNVLRPRLVGQRARLHELVIFFSLVGGLKVFGILGLFVGPVVAAIALALKDVFREANAAAEAGVEKAAPVVVMGDGGGDGEGHSVRNEESRNVQLSTSNVQLPTGTIEREEAPREGVGGAHPTNPSSSAPGQDAEVPRPR